MKIQNVSTGTLARYFKFKNEMSVFDNEVLLFCTRRTSIEMDGYWQWKSELGMPPYSKSKAPIFK